MGGAFTARKSCTRALPFHTMDDGLKFRNMPSDFDRDQVLRHRGAWSCISSRIISAPTAMRLHIALVQIGTTVGDSCDCLNCKTVINFRRCRRLRLRLPTLSVFCALEELRGLPVKQPLCCRGRQLTGVWFCTPAEVRTE
jgi:hypothetical protein